MNQSYKVFLNDKCNEMDRKLEKAIERFDRAVDECDSLEIYRADRDVRKLERESDYWYARLESYMSGSDHWDF
jgi:hypothetical protein